MKHHSLLVASLALALTPALAAQLPQRFVVPIHVAEADPDLGGGGIWAAGTDYKASFHDGFTFYPVLGSNRPHNLPLRWGSTRFVVDGVDVDGNTFEVRTRYTQARFERDHGPVITEAYDVREDGVEQTFVLRARPARDGDLRIVGFVETPLAIPESPLRNAPLTFTDDAGRPVIEYGTAIAYDAIGRTIVVPIGARSQTIELLVDRAFLASATYPVVVDPLIRNVVVEAGADRIGTVDVVRDDETNEILVVYSRASSASDYDAFGRIVTDELQSSVPIWTDIVASNSTTLPSVCFIGGADRYAIAFQRTSTPFGASRVRVYVHPRAGRVHNGGTTLHVSPPVDSQDATPTIAGTPGNDAGTRAYLAWRRDVASTATNTDTSVVLGCVLDGVTLTFTNQRVLAGNGTIDAENPSLARSNSGAATPWMLTWQEHSNAASTMWRVFCRQVRNDGTTTGHHRFGTNTGGYQNVYPRVEGGAGRYIATWLDRQTTVKNGIVYGTRLRSYRFDWQADGIANGIATETVAEVPTLRLRVDLDRGFAFDSLTQSLWSVVWQDTEVGLQLARLGADGRVGDRVTVHPRATGDTPTGAGVCFDDDRQRHLIAFGRHAQQAEVRLAEYAAGSEVPTTFGTPCGGRIRAASRSAGNRFLAGDDDVQVVLLQGQPNRTTLLLLSPAPAATPLPLPASAGCFLLIAPTPLVVAASGASDSIGTFRARFPLPSTTFGGSVHWQFLQVGTSALHASEGLTTPVR